MMKRHSLWLMLLLEAYALLCFYFLLTLFAEVAVPEFVTFRGFLH